MNKIPGTGRRRQGPRAASMTLTALAAAVLAASGAALVCPRPVMAGDWRISSTVENTTDTTVSDSDSGSSVFVYSGGYLTNYATVTVTRSSSFAEVIFAESDGGTVVNEEEGVFYLYSGESYSGITFSSSGTFINRGTVTASAGTTARIHFNDTGGGTFENASTGTVNLEGGEYACVAMYTADALVTNAGTITAAAPVSYILARGGSFENSGTVILEGSSEAYIRVTESGSFSNTAGLTAVDSVDAWVYNDGTVSVSGGILAVGSGAASIDTGSAPGIYILEGGAFTTASGGTSSATLLDVAGSWASSGTTAVEGDLTVESTGTYTSSGTTSAASLESSGTYTNTGTTEISGQLTNQGTFTSSGNVSAAGLTSSGTFRNTGSVSVTGDIENTAGTFTSSGSVEAGGTLAVSGGTFTNAGSVSADGGLTVSAGSLTNSQGASLTAASVTSYGRITNEGSITVAGAVDNCGIWTDAGSVVAGTTLANSGTIDASSGSVTAQDVLTNSGTITVSSSSGVVSGTTLASTAGTITAATVMSTAGSLTNAGTISATSVSSASGLENSGTIAGAGGGSEAASSVSGTDVTNTGIIYASSLSSTSGSVTNAGTIEAENLSAAASLANSGSVTVSGTLSAGSVSNTAGTLTSTGEAAVSGGISASGGTIELAGTTSAGSVSVSGGTVSSTGTLVIAGASSAGDDLTLSVASGTFVSSGTLDIGLYNLFEDAGTVTSGLVSFVDLHAAEAAEAGEHESTVWAEFSGVELLEAVQANVTLSGSTVILEYVNDNGEAVLTLAQYDALVTAIHEAWGEDVAVTYNGSVEGEAVSNVMNMLTVNRLAAIDGFVDIIYTTESLQGEGGDVVITTGESYTDDDGEYISDAVVGSFGFVSIEDAASVTVRDGSTLVLIGSAGADTELSGTAAITVTGEGSTLQFGTESLAGSGDYGGTAGDVILEDGAAFSIVTGSYTAGDISAASGSASISEGASLAAGSLILDSASSLANAGTASFSSVTSAGTVTDSGSTTVTGSINNSGSWASASGITAGGAIANSGTMTASSGTVSAESLENSGTLTAAAIETASWLDNSGTVTASEELHAGSLSNSGTVTVSGGTTTITGSFTNLEGGDADWTGAELVIASGAAGSSLGTLSAGMLSIEEDAAFENSGTLVAASLTVSGSLTSAGSAEASSFTVTEGGSVLSSGELAMDGEGNLYIEDGGSLTVAAGGSLDASGAATVIAGSLENAGTAAYAGMTVSAAGSSAVLEGGSEEGGSLDVSGSHAVAAAARSAWESVTVAAGGSSEISGTLATSTLSVLGSLEVTGSGSLSAAGASVSGTAALANSGSVNFDSLSAGGSAALTNDAEGALTAAILDISDAGSLVLVENSGTATVTTLLAAGATGITNGTTGILSVADMSLEDAAAFANEGIAATESLTLAGSAEVTNNGALEAGYMELSGASSLESSGTLAADTLWIGEGSGVVNSSGSLTVDGLAWIEGTFTNSGYAEIGGSALVYGTLSNSSSGSLHAGSLAVYGTLENSGEIEASTFSFGGTVQSAGVSTLSLAAESAAVSGEDGDEDSSGAILVNSGTISVDETLAISGTVTNTGSVAAGTLEIESGTFTNSGELSFAEADISGILINTAEGSINGAGSITVEAGGSFDQQGTVGEELTAVTLAAADGETAGGALLIEAGTAVTTLTAEEGSSITVSGGAALSVVTLAASGVTYTQEDGSITAAAGWFTDSVLNISGGTLDASALSDADGNALNGLGSGNTVNIAGTEAGDVSIDSSASPAEKSAYYAAAGLTVVYVTGDAVLDSATTVNIYEGGLLDVDTISLDGETEATLNLAGGVLQTSLDQVFAEVGTSAVLLDAESTSDTTLVPSTVLAADTVSGLAEGIAAGLTVSGSVESIIAFDDALYSTGLVAQVSAVLAENMDNAENLTVYFLGTLSDVFSVTTAAYLAEEGLEEVSSPGIVLASTTLYNMTAEEGSCPGSCTYETETGSDGSESYVFSKSGLVIGTISGDEAEDANSVTLSMGWQDIAGAEYVIVRDAETALAGFSADGLSYSDDGAKLLSTSGDGGSITLENASLAFGSDGLASGTVGWVSSLSVDGESSFTAANGEFAA